MGQWSLRLKRRGGGEDPGFCVRQLLGLGLENNCPHPGIVLTQQLSCAPEHPDFLITGFDHGLMVDAETVGRNPLCSHIVYN